MPCRLRLVTSVSGFLLICIGHAQPQTTRSVPPTPSLQLRLPPAGRYTLPALNGEETSSATNTGAALAAIERPTDTTLMASASCQSLPAGGYLWRVGIRSPEARGIAVHFTGFSVGNGKVWLHNGGRDPFQSVGPYSGRGPLGNGDFQSAVVFAPEVVVELENDQSHFCPEKPPFHIRAITHVWSAAASTAPGPAKRAKLGGPVDAASVQCIVNSGVPPTDRSEGLTELTGDVVLNCSGVTPAAAGTLVPQTNITLFLNTPVTSRLFAAGAEPMLLIDEPSPTQQILCVPGTANPGAPTNPNYCPMVGTGGNANEFKSGNANVFMGSVFGNSVTFTGVPIDPAAGLNSRIYRITNVRADAAALGPGGVNASSQVVALLSASDSNLLSVNNAQQVVAFVQPSLGTDQRTVDNSASLGVPPAFVQCTPLPPQRFMTVRFAETFATAFKTRTVAPFAGTETSPVPQAQNTAGLSYNTESGFYSPVFPGSAGLAGLADFGTRLKAIFNHIPAGVTLLTSTVPVRFVGGAPLVSSSSNQARLVLNETGVFTPVPSIGTLEGIPVAPLPALNGSATAIWEVLGSSSLAIENFDFPIWINLNTASSGLALLNLSYAPVPPSFAAGAGAIAQGPTFPVPRFVDTSTSLGTLQITGCGPQVSAIVSTNPAGQVFLVDGSPFTAAQSMSWATGSSHTLSVVSPQFNGPGSRAVFANWSDGGVPAHSVAPSTSTTYTANFVAQYLLTTNIANPASGTLLVSPSSPDGFYNSGTSVQLTAVPGPGFQFSGWSGDLGGTANPQTLIINGPRTVIPLFTPLSLAAPQLISPVNGATGVSLTPSLAWGAVSGAVSYDVFLGTTNPPVSFRGVAGPVAQNFTGVTYSPGKLDLGVTYFWLIVAKSSSGIAASAIGSFTIQTTAPSGGRGNLLVWRPASGTWYVNPFFGATASVQWGLPGDIPLAADFDHDGGADFVVWRPADGNWYIRQSSNFNVPIIRQWGLPGDVPVPGDFDGDGRTDFTVWRPSTGTWYIIPSTPGPSIVQQWGLPNDIPLAADFDGDGKADLTVWRPSNGTWYIILSRSGGITGRQWGLPGDIPVPADYDGDGVADFAVWRPAEGNWYIVPSSNPSAAIIRQWGLPGDIPVPRDYDGDGNADLAVWRPSNGTWYILPSGSLGAPLQIQWGLPGDVPIGKFDGVVAGVATSTAGMASRRARHTATLLGSNKVLVTGGDNFDTGVVRVVGTAESYDPAAGTWAAPVPLRVARSSHRATLLADGRVLLTGGVIYQTPPAQPIVLADAEIYNPVTGLFTAVGSMAMPRTGHTAVRLADGRVLIAGGIAAYPADSGLKSAEIFNPATGAFSPTLPLNVSRAFHSATLLANGQVLIVGGLASIGAPAEFYDPVRGQFSVAATPLFSTLWHTATALAGNQVLLAGGWLLNGPTALTQIYDVASGQFQPGPALTSPRYLHEATPLLDGSVLFTGGAGPGGVRGPAVDIYSPASRLIVAAPPMLNPRAEHTATALPAGTVLLAGGTQGSDQGIFWTNAAEIYAAGH